MTRITLEEPRAAGYPVVKRTALGQTFVGAVIKAESRDRMKTENGELKPIIKANGKHAQELVVTALALPGTTAPAGLGDHESVPEPGDIVRLILKGKAFGDWIEAKNALPGGSVAVGDVVTQTTAVAQVYDPSGNPTGGEITDQAGIDAARVKGRSVGIYGPLTLKVSDDPMWEAKAVEAYNSLKDRVSVEPENAYSSGGGLLSGNAPQKPTDFPQATWDRLSDEGKKNVADEFVPF